MPLEEVYELWIMKVTGSSLIFNPFSTNVPPIWKPGS